MEFDDFEFEDNDDILDEKLDIEKIKSNIGSYKDETLCEIIVCNRYFNINNDLTVICMSELGQRRANGNSFDFETFIQKNLDDLPKINLNVFDLSSLFGDAKK
jgi:hypothetical protein